MNTLKKTEVETERRLGFIPLSERNAPEWTQDEAIAYECACDTISHYIAIKTHLIHKEEQKENPDLKLITLLKEESRYLFRERRDLKLKDHANIARIRSKYGTIIRAFSEKKEAD